jgi:hypothetical protein
VPELRANRKFDTAHLREMRKRADNAVRGKKEAEAIAAECMDDIAEITSGKRIVYLCLVRYCIHTLFFFRLYW